MGAGKQERLSVGRSSSSTEPGDTGSRAQLAHFLTWASEDSLYAAWVLLATTGMRRGGVLGLRREDLDLEAGLIRIRQALIAVSSRIYVSEPKTKKANRQVLLAPQVVDCLRRHYMAGGGQKSSGRTEFLFTSRGLPVHPDRFSRRFVSLCRRADLPRIRLHDLRHTFATLALCEGINPKVVSEILGHANIAITLETYSHALPSLQREATARVTDLVFSAEDPSSGVPHGI